MVFVEGYSQRHSQGKGTEAGSGGVGRGWVQRCMETANSDTDLPQANPKLLGDREEKDTELPTKKGLIPS